MVTVNLFYYEGVPTANTSKPRRMRGSLGPPGNPGVDGLKGDVGIPGLDGVPGAKGEMGERASIKLFYSAQITEGDFVKVLGDMGEDGPKGEMGEKTDEHGCQERHHLRETDAGYHLWRMSEQKGKWWR
ncbi:hypothetical protein INR49_011773 [Caranx melampygus]|nr:hypothetical protein INR49_011773 [Caranx melampygus]